jgi:hypothetical protein
MQRRHQRPGPLGADSSPLMLANIVLPTGSNHGCSLPTDSRLANVGAAPIEQNHTSTRRFPASPIQGYES